MTQPPDNGSQTTDTPRHTYEAILSLGSNEGDRLAWINQACVKLSELPGTRLAARSPIYETEPVGTPPDSSASLYLNGVVIIETRLVPSDFSRAIHAIEASLGRIRGDTPNLPRTLDIDIIAIDRLTSDDPELTLPHPRARRRLFVLRPLADLRPDFRFPCDKRTVTDLLHALPPGPRVTRHI